MMKYIAYGMIAALIIDATLIRMLLVPATMKLLGDDCWWAPPWMKRIQQKIGLGEPILDDELLPIEDVPELALAGGVPSTTVAPPMRPAPRPAPAAANRSPNPFRLSHLRVRAPSGRHTPRRKSPGAV